MARVNVAHVVAIIGQSRVKFRGKLAVLGAPHGPWAKCHAGHAIQSCMFRTAYDDYLPHNIQSNLSHNLGRVECPQTTHFGGPPGWSFQLPSQGSGATGLLRGLGLRREREREIGRGWMQRQMSGVIDSGDCSSQAFRGGWQVKPGAGVNTWAGLSLIATPQQSFSFWSLTLSSSNGHHDTRSAHPLTLSTGSMLTPAAPQGVSVVYVSLVGASSRRRTPSPNTKGKAAQWNLSTADSQPRLPVGRRGQGQARRHSRGGCRRLRPLCWR